MRSGRSSFFSSVLNGSGSMLTFQPRTCCSSPAIAWIQRLVPGTGVELEVDLGARRQARLLGAAALALVGSCFTQEAQMPGW